MPKPSPEIPLLKQTVHLPQNVLMEARRAAQREGVSFSRWIVRAASERLERPPLSE